MRGAATGEGGRCGNRAGAHRAGHSEAILVFVDPHAVAQGRVAAQVVFVEREQGHGGRQVLARVVRVGGDLQDARALVEAPAPAKHGAVCRQIQRAAV